MGADPGVEVPSGVVPVRKSRLRIRSLMVWVALVGAGLGWVLHTVRTERAFQADRAIFAVWAAEFEKDNPALKPLGRSMSSTWNFLELDQRLYQNYQTAAGGRFSIQLVLRGGPFWGDRRVDFESPGRSATWPFEDIARGRKVDLKTEFPEAFR
jgi:hypothetical protein